MDPMKILITGANGFAARHLIRHLHTFNSVKVFATDIHPECSLNQLIEQYIQCDLSDWIACETKLGHHRFDVIIHLAAYLEKSDSRAVQQRYIAINVSATQSLLDLARKNKSRFIFTSSALVYGNARSPFSESDPTEPIDFYAQSKLQAEVAITTAQRRYSLAFVILRPTILYGPDQPPTMFIPQLVQALKNGEDFEMSPGEQQRDFLYIDDFTAAVSTVVHTPALQGIYNVGSGTSHLLIDVAKMAQRLVQSADCLKIGALPYRHAEVWHYGVQITKLCTQSDWKPATSLQDGLRAMITAKEEL